MCHWIIIILYVCFFQANMYHCERCSKSYNRQSSLVNHSHVHDELWAFSVCQKTFENKASLNCILGFFIDLETGILHKQIYEEQPGGWVEVGVRVSGRPGAPIWGQYGYVVRSPPFSDLAAHKDSTFSTWAAPNDPLFKNIQCFVPLSRPGQTEKTLVLK